MHDCPYGFDNYLVNVKTIRKIAQICVAFSEELNFKRINPVVGGGEHAILSTATKLSKFGVPLIDETKERIIGLYKSYKWMNGIHAHVGSQGIPINLFGNAVKV